MKSNSSAKKRFTVTGSGKIKRSQSGKQHLLRKRSKKTKLSLTHNALVNKADEKSIRNLLCLQ